VEGVLVDYKSKMVVHAALRAAIFGQTSKRLTISRQILSLNRIAGPSASIYFQICDQNRLTIGSILSEKTLAEVVCPFLS
jgi:hypothetical protein